MWINFIFIVPLLHKLLSNNIVFWFLLDISNIFGQISSEILNLAYNLSLKSGKIPIFEWKMLGFAPKLVDFRSKIGIFQKVIFFDVDELYGWYRYEKACKDIEEAIFESYMYHRPFPATIYISKLCKISQNYQKNQFFRFFKLCPEVAGNVIYGRKSAIWDP